MLMHELSFGQLAMLRARMVRYEGPVMVSPADFADAPILAHICYTPWVRHVCNIVFCTGVCRGASGGGPSMPGQIGPFSPSHVR